MWGPIPDPPNDDMIFTVLDQVTMAEERPKNNYESDPKIVGGFRNNQDPL